MKYKKLPRRPAAVPTVRLSLIGLAVLLSTGAQAQQTPSAAPASGGAAAEVNALPVVRVSAKAADKGYLPSTEAATAPGLTAQETPSVIGVISSDFLKDSGATRLTDILSYVPGVTTADNVGSPSERITIRGFSQNASGIGVGGTYFNGMRQAVTSAQYRSLDNIERVEIVKGPAGVEGGISDPGGFVNFVTKKPQRTFAAEGHVGGGDYGYRTLGVDVTGPLTESKNIQYRLIASHNELAAWRPGRQKRPQDLVAPSVNFDYAPGSFVTVEYERLKSNDPLDRGTIYLKGAGFPGDFAGRNWSFHQASDSIAASSERFDVDWTHQLASGWQARLRYQHMTQSVRTDAFRNAGTSPGDALYKDDGLTWSGDPVIVLGYNRDRTRLRAETLEASVRGDFKAFGLDHTLVVGLNANRGRDAFISYDGDHNFVDTDNTVSLFSPNNQQQPHVVGSYTNGDFRRGSDLKSAFAQWVARITPAWRTVLSVRRDNYKGFAISETLDGSPPFYNPKASNHLTSARVATSLDLTPQVTAFAGYGSSYVPQVGIDRNGAQIDPLRAQSMEAGVKTSLFDKRALWTNTVYQITQDHQTVCDPVDPVDCKFLLLYGKTRMRGFESELVGEITPQLQLSAGLSLMAPKILQNGDGYTGNKYPNVPRVQASAFANYRWADFGLPQLATRLGLIRVGEREANSGNTYRLPAYTRIDAGVNFAFTPKLSLDLHVENLLDKTYYTSAQDGGAGAGQIGVGNRRLMQAVVRFAI